MWWAYSDGRVAVPSSRPQQWGDYSQHKHTGRLGTGSGRVNTSSIAGARGPGPGEGEQGHRYLFAGAAPCPWHARPARCARRRLRGGCRRRAHPLAVRPRAQWRLAALDGRTLRGSGPEHRPHQLSDTHAGYGRGLRGGPAVHPRAAAVGAGPDRCRGPRDLAAGSAADIPGRVRLHRLRAPGRTAQPRPLHEFPRADPHRPGLPLPRLALPALPLRAAVHAAHLRPHAPRPGGRTVGAEGARRARQPGSDRVSWGCRGAHGPLAARRRGVRGAQSGLAGAGCRRRPQRHAGAAGACGRTGFDRHGCGRHSPFAPRGPGRAYSRRHSRGRHSPPAARGPLSSF
jgi:hypothetical protein